MWRKDWSEERMLWEGGGKETDRTRHTLCEGYVREGGRKERKDAMGK